MKIIDNDLISIQESRIILEKAALANEIINDYDDNLLKEVTSEIREYFTKTYPLLVKEASNFTNYGKAEDEIKLIEYYLKNLDDEINKHYKLNQVYKLRDSSYVIKVQKGISLVFIASYLPILTTFQSIYLSLLSKSPIIIVPPKRCSGTIIKMIKDIEEIAEKYYLPKGSISILKNISEEGEKNLYNSEKVSLIVENILCEDKRNIKNKNADVFVGEIGNNIVFIDDSANIKKAVEEIVYSKSYNNGLLPGVEQSVVVDRNVYKKTITYFKENGAYFLSKEEEQRLQEVIFDKDLNPRQEMIGKSAIELAKMAKIHVEDDTKILIVTKPYVSKKSPYSKEKYHPILSVYIEDDWLHACEKCIELILNDKKGQSLSVYSTDSFVIEQFIEKKPVSRILINTSTGFGSIGISSNLPLSFSLSTRHDLSLEQTSLNVEHFLKTKEIGKEDQEKFKRFMNTEVKQTRSDLFDSVVKNIYNN